MMEGGLPCQAGVGAHHGARLSADGIGRGGIVRGDTLSAITDAGVGIAFGVPVDAPIGLSSWMLEGVLEGSWVWAQLCVFSDGGS